MANLHSHAFQRAMAGLTELRGGAEDDFWTWRELMYRFVERLTPDQAQVVAHFLYIDMLRHGYTAVAEFHYVHRPDGMLQAHLDAAREAGIAITLMPSVYRWSGSASGRCRSASRRSRATPTPCSRRMRASRRARRRGENRGRAAFAARGRSGCARGARRRSPARRADPHPRRGADA
jgi:formimidoylglutamate deiminase